MLSFKPFFWFGLVCIFFLYILHFKKHDFHFVKSSLFIWSKCNNEPPRKYDLKNRFELDKKIKEPLLSIRKLSFREEMPYIFTIGQRTTFNRKTHCAHLVYKIINLTKSTRQNIDFSRTQTCFEYYWNDHKIPVLRRKGYHK